MKRIRYAAVVAAACMVFSACGSRVAPLADQGSNAGLGQPGATNGPFPAGSQAPIPGSTIPAGSNPFTAPPPGIIRKDCHGGATDRGVTASTIKLGLVASINGPLQGAFDSEVEAVDSYYKAINDAGGICGRKVQLLVRDDNGNGNTDLLVSQKLAEEDKIFAFVGSTSAPDDSGIAKMSRKYKLPDIGFPLTWERVESPYTFGVPGAVQHEVTGEGASGTTYLNKTHNIKQVAIFWLRESEVSVLSAWGFEAADIKASNGTIKICHEQPSGVLDSNYRNYVLAMEADCDPANGPVAVYTTMENKSNIKLAKAIKEQGFNAAVFAPTFSSYSQSFISGSEGATEGAYIAMPQIPFERLDRPQREWTRGTFELKRYVDTLYRYYPRPTPPGSFGAPGWGNAALFAEVAASCGAALTRACVLSGLESAPPYSDNGLYPPNRPGDHTIYHADLLVQVRGGKFVEVRPNDKSGPPGAPDFWNVSKLFNWGEYFCAHQSLFPNAAEKKKLVRARDHCRQGSGP